MPGSRKRKQKSKPNCIEIELKSATHVERLSPTKRETRYVVFRYTDEWEFFIDCCTMSEVRAEIRTYLEEVRQPHETEAVVFQVAKVTLG